MWGRVQADVHGDILLHHLPVLQALCSSRVNRHWHACCAAIFNPAEMRVACGRGLLLRAGDGGYDDDGSSSPDPQAAVAFAHAIRTSFSLHIVSKTVSSPWRGALVSQSRPEHFLRVDVPVPVVTRMRDELLSHFSRLCSRWFFNIDFELAQCVMGAGAAGASDHKGRRRMATMFQLYEITHAVILLEKALGRQEQEMPPPAAAGGHRAHRDVDRAPPNLFRAFWMVAASLADPDRRSVVPLATVVRALAYDMGDLTATLGDSWFVQREILRGLRKRLDRDHFIRCAVAIVDALPADSAAYFEQWGLQTALSDLTLDDDEVRSFCYAVAESRNPCTLHNEAVLGAVFAACAFTGEFWVKMTPVLVRTGPEHAVYASAFLRHLSDQQFDLAMLSNYLLFVVHNAPFAVKLKFFKLCIDRSADIALAHSPPQLQPVVDTEEDGAQGEQDEDEEEDNDNEDEEEDNDNEDEATEYAQPLPQTQQQLELQLQGAPEDGDAHAPDVPAPSNGGGGRTLTKWALAHGLLAPDRITLLVRASSKSAAFWRWCIGQMIDASPMQWAHQLEALSMHR